MVGPRFVLLTLAIPLLGIWLRPRAARIPVWFAAGLVTIGVEMFVISICGGTWSGWMLVPLPLIAAALLWGRPPAGRAAGGPPARASSAPTPRPPKADSANGVLSFFQNAPVQFDPTAISAVRQADAPSMDLKRGQRVQHEQFGVGTILTMEGSGPDAKLTVYFERHGSKKFIARFAKLKRA